MTTAPLLANGDLDAIFAWSADGPLSIDDYLLDADWLSEQLPAAGYLLNLCHDRYRFAVGFAAGLLRGMTSLQPSSQTPETFRRLQTDYPGLICLCDGAADTLDLPRLDFPADFLATSTVNRKKQPKTKSAIPQIPAEHLAAILFTSGSTGLPQAQRKTWGKLVANGRAEAVALGLDRQPHAIVGTVPVQHSYGFESTFLLALHGGCAFWAGKPFYPQDIAGALAAVPQPRLLVTTPFHLSALLSAEIELPPVDMLLSATAPLSTTLAAEAEARTGAPMLEIYGSTESGQLASRRTTAPPTMPRCPATQTRLPDRSYMVAQLPLPMGASRMVSRSACTISRARSRGLVSCSQPSTVLALVGSPISSSTSVGRK